MGGTTQSGLGPPPSRKCPAQRWAFSQLNSLLPDDLDLDQVDAKLTSIFILFFFFFFLCKSGNRTQQFIRAMQIRELEPFPEPFAFIHEEKKFCGYHPILTGKFRESYTLGFENLRVSCARDWAQFHTYNRHYHWAKLSAPYTNC